MDAWIRTKLPRCRRRLSTSILALAVAMAALSLVDGVAVATPKAGVSVPAAHRIVYQVTSNDPAAMQHALSSADNAFKFYRGRAEHVTIEIVANGGGVHMMRADTTPVTAMLGYMRAAYPTDLILSACGNTKTIMEANEGRSITLLDGVQVVPAGIVRVVELQERGYAYIKP